MLTALRIVGLTIAGAFSCWRCELALASGRYYAALNHLLTADRRLDQAAALHKKKWGS